jgi:hypothetical protein
MTQRNWLAALLAGAFLTATAAVEAQGPAPAPPRKIYTNRTSFKLPLRVDPKDRPRLRAVELFVRKGPDDRWVMKESVPPTENQFVYHAQEDGEYWFTVVTVDKENQRNPNPADLSHEPPGLVVVVDRQAPSLEVRPMNGSSGQPLLECEIRDVNPDLAKTKLEYLTPDQTWHTLEALPDQPTVFRVPDPAALRGVVRATAVDLAGNKTTREINLFTAATLPAEPPAPALLENRSSRPPMVENRTPIMDSRTERPPAIENRPERQPLAENRTERQPPVENRPERPPVIENRTDRPFPAVLPESSRTDRQFINTTHATLKYQIEEEGPSGVGRVEVWMTRDDGQSWQKLCEDPDRRSPVDIDLPGEGVYGLTVVVTSGNGNGGNPPARGDVPDWRVEVDTQKPEAQIVAVRTGTGQEAGSFLINWTASDKNLRPEPIELEYASRQEGPWLPITKALHNDGNYRWMGPSEPSGRFFVRMHVTDLAGNRTTCMAPEPIILDRSRPKGKVLGLVTGVGQNGYSGN